MIKNLFNWEDSYEKGHFIFLSILIWFAYIITVPCVWHFSRFLGTAFIIFPGLFVSNLIIYFQHETWHGYFKTPLNRTLFEVLCAIAFTQPHLYDIAHRTHHARVNTYDDLEFYPIGKIENKALRILCNFFSITLGSLFLLFLGVNQPSGLTKSQSFARLAISMFAWLTIWGGVAYASFMLFKVSPWEIVNSYLFTIWLVSVFHHHNELIEHGNLIVEGDFKFRSSQTRNLAANGLVTRIFLFLVHQDSREHTLHHTDPSTYSRPFVGRYPMPKTAVYITFAEYAGILKAMLLGKTEIIEQK